MGALNEFNEIIRTRGGENAMSFHLASKLMTCAITWSLILGWCFQCAARIHQLN